MLLKVFFGFALISWNYSAAHREVPELCVVSSPLVTPYFIPWLETPSKAVGCWASPHQNTPLEVHAVFLRGKQVSPVVNLEVIGSEPHGSLVIVLASEHTVTWKLTASLPSETVLPLVVVSSGSNVESVLSLNISHHSWPNRRSVQRYLLHKFGAVSSYTEVHTANRMELAVGKSWSQEHCDFHLRNDSRVVTASQAVPLRTEGCFHESYIGDDTMDVYVVEMDAGPSHSGRGGRNVLPVVLVRLLEGEGDRLVMELRNLTLVLKSSHPVLWRFGQTPRNLDTVLVVNNGIDQVENKDVHKLRVHSMPLPDKLDALLMSVTSEYGPPVMYAKTGRASTLNLVVGTCSDSDCGTDTAKLNPTSSPDSNLFSDQMKMEKDSHGIMHQQPGTHPKNMPPDLKTNEGRAGILAQLKKVMAVDCKENRFTISFPLFLVKELGSPQLSFSEGRCTAISNVSHVILSSPITSCGSTFDVDGRHTTFHNSIHVKSSAPSEADARFETSELYGDLADDAGIPVVCKYEPFYIGGHHDPEDGNTVDSLDQESTSYMSLYNMELYRDKQFLHKLNFTGSDTKEAEVIYEDKVYVHSWMEGGTTQVQLVTENCWLSNSSNSRSKTRIFLIRNACPMSQYVSLLDEHGSFSFQAKQEFSAFGLIYLHCRIGMCTHFEELTRGNLVMCVDTKQHCARVNTQPFVNKTTVSTAQQFVTRGPMRIVPRFRKSVTTTAAIPTASPPAQAVLPNIANPDTSCVSVEAAVGIALASFVIGSALTGILWFIHTKTDPLKQQRAKQQAQQTGMLGLAGGVASPSSHCSSSNSQSVAGS